PRSSLHARNSGSAQRARNIRERATAEQAARESKPGAYSSLTTFRQPTARPAVTEQPCVLPSPVNRAPGMGEEPRIPEISLQVAVICTKGSGAAYPGESHDMGIV